MENSRQNTSDWQNTQTAAELIHLCIGKGFGAGCQAGDFGLAGYRILAADEGEETW